MAEKDLVVSGLRVSQDNIVFDMNELYQVMKKWCKINRYDLEEKAIEHEAIPEGKEEIIRWHIKREADNYIQFVIRSTIKIVGKDVDVIKKGKAVKGGISVNLEAWLDKDYDREWEESPVFRFMRDFYNRFILAGKYKNYSKALKNDTHDLFNEVRAFLDLHIPRK